MHCAKQYHYFDRVFLAEYWKALQDAMEWKVMKTGANLRKSDRSQSLEREPRCSKRDMFIYTVQRGKGISSECFVKALPCSNNNQNYRDLVSGTLRLSIMQKHPAIAIRRKD